MFNLFPDSVLSGFSSQKDGDMIITAQNLDNAINRAKFFVSQKIDPASVRAVMLKHNSAVQDVSAKSPSIIGPGDGLVTKDKNTFLSVTGADCLPIYAYEKSGIIGLVHCGWRGAKKGIATNLVKKMIELGAEPGQILVGIGPGLGQCHFEVQSDVASQFPGYITSGRLDLAGYIIEQLLKAGVQKENIEDSRLCTHCDKNYFSYRRDGLPLKGQVAYIGLKS